LFVYVEENCGIEATPEMPGVSTTSFAFAENQLKILLLNQR